MIAKVIMVTLGMKVVFFTIWHENIGLLTSRRVERRHSLHEETTGSSLSETMP